jgi:hypothetical protein
MPLLRAVPGTSLQPSALYMKVALQFVPDSAPTDSVQYLYSDLTPWKPILIVADSR